MEFELFSRLAMQVELQDILNYICIQGGPRLTYPEKQRLNPFFFFFFYRYLYRKNLLFSLPLGEICSWGLAVRKMSRYDELREEKLIISQSLMRRSQEREQASAFEKLDGAGINRYSHVKGAPAGCDYADRPFRNCRRTRCSKVWHETMLGIEIRF